MIKNVMQTKFGITINIDECKSLKKNCAEKVIFGILLHVVLKIVDM